MVDITYYHPPLYPLPSREGLLKKSPLPLWERVRVRDKKLKQLLRSLKINSINIAYAKC
jgi:hypothetical protein